MLTAKYKDYLANIRNEHFGGQSAEEHKIIQRTMIKKHVPFANAISTANEHGEILTITDQKSVHNLIAKSLENKFEHNPKWEFENKF